MHVGHHGAELSPTAQSVSQLEVSQGQTRSCCQHQCHSRPADSEQDAPADHEHDSDRCSVCQNFLALRIAAMHIGDVEQWEVADVVERAVVEADAIPEQVILAARSSRGPPHA